MAAVFLLNADCEIKATSAAKTPTPNTETRRSPPAAPLERGREQTTSTTRVSRAASPSTRSSIWSLGNELFQRFLLRKQARGIINKLLLAQINKINDQENRTQNNRVLALTQSHSKRHDGELTQKHRCSSVTVLFGSAPAAETDLSAGWPHTHTHTHTHTSLCRETALQEDRATDRAGVQQ